jgi:TetR/AcrR family transcriptional regulator, lmrAB and yxaGH operons repressor
MTARERMLSAASRLLQYQGVEATGVLQVLAEAHAPRGSLYHHFPGGKAQLVTEALELNAEQATQLLVDVIERTPDAAAALHEFAEGLAAGLVSTDFQGGCPISTAILEQAATNDTVADIGDRAFDSLREIIGNELRQLGVGESDDLALLCVAAFEGALILARAKRDVAPIHGVARMLTNIFERSHPA